MAGLLGVTLGARAAQASGFVGSSVSLGHFVPQDTTAFDGPYNILVVDAGPDGGSPDRVLLSAFAGCATPSYGVTVLQDSVVIDFVADVTFTAGNPFHGLVIQNLVRPGSTASVTGGSFQTVTYDGATLELNWQGVGVAAGTVYTVTFTPGTGGGTPLATACSSFALGACTACDAGASPLCAGVDAGATPFCDLAYSDAGPVLAVDAAAAAGADAGAGATDAALGESDGSATAPTDDGGGTPTSDGGSTPTSDGGSGGATGGSSSSCSCRVVPARDGAFAGGAAASLAALVFARRRRRR